MVCFPVQDGGVVIKVLAGEVLVERRLVVVFDGATLEVKGKASC